jgi:tryptophan synthase alpha chain
VSRIDDKFRQLGARNGKAFIPFLTAGDPSLEATYEFILAMEEAGADVIELGVPFSDPIADGPVIQRATDRALRAGTSLSGVLDLVRRIRRTSEVPLMLFSYFNPLLNRGLDRLASEAEAAGVDGILASDLTVEESGRFVEAVQGAGLNTVFLVAPTSSPERIRKIAEASTGFLYAVSRTGVTGTRNALSGDLVDFIRQLRGHTRNPIAVGFGISRPEHVRAVWKEADGAVVGSAIVEQIEQGPDGPAAAERLGDFVRWLRTPAETAAE